MVALGIVVVRAMVSFGVRILATPYDGSSISISNRCGHDVYAVDALDGILIAAGEPIRWDHASRSREKTIRLQRSDPTAGPVGDDVTVTLRGDSDLAGPDCPLHP